MNVLITGIAGLIGKNLTANLNSKEYKITGIDKKPDDEIEKQIHNYITCDLSNEDLLSICKDIEVVIHLAGEASLGKRAATYKRNNEIASKNLIAAVINNQVKKIIFVSSKKVGQKDHYSVSKLYVESMIQNETKSKLTNYTIIRSASVYGRGMKNNIAKWIWQIKNNNVFSLPKSNSELDMIGIDDLGRCIKNCITNELTNNKIYELSDGCIYNINDIESAARKLFGNQKTIIICPKWIIFLGAKFGDLLTNINFRFPLNSRIYNFLFHNKVIPVNEFCKDTGYEFKQNFLHEMPGIFKEENKK